MIFWFYYDKCNKIIKKTYIFKLFNLYIKELNPLKKIEIIYKIIY